MINWTFGKWLNIFLLTVLVVPSATSASIAFPPELQVSISRFLTSDDLSLSGAGDARFYRRDAFGKDESFKCPAMASFNFEPFHSDMGGYITVGVCPKESRLNENTAEEQAKRFELAALSGGWDMRENAVKLQTIQESGVIFFHYRTGITETMLMIPPGSKTVILVQGELPINACLPKQMLPLCNSFRDAMREIARQVYAAQPKLSLPQDPEIELSVQPTFTAEAITGKVVDEETGEPLAGVIIVAKWTIEASFVGYDNELLNVLETVSDKDGNYGFPGWGPKLLPVLTYPFSSSDLFDKGDDPFVVYFKSGYWPAQEYNGVTYPGQDIAKRVPTLGGFKANGMTIKLKKWDGKDEEKYYTQVSSMADDLNGGWKKYPRMALAIDQITQQLLKRMKRKEIPQYFPVPHVEGFFMKDLSEEDRAYLKEYSE